MLFMSILQAFMNGRCDIVDPCNRISSVNNVDDIYDFIVVGGGTAGPIVASRLAENPHIKVLLIEAGSEEPVASAVPSFYRNYFGNPDVDWMYRTQPQDDACLDQEQKGCWWPRGKSLGGSSVINGMMFHRGHKADYDNWVEQGATGWSWEENMKYFHKFEDNKQIGSLVSPEFHSSDGPMPVQQFRFQPLLAKDLLEAIDSVNLPIINDMNDPNTPEGFTVAQAFNNNGQRYTPSRAYLRPAVKRSSQNIHVLLNTLVIKILIQGQEAFGVEYLQGYNRSIVRASKEVIMCAGALNTPHVLMLSGIGPRPTLEKHDIPVVADLPVGENLRNHLGINLNFVLDKVENDRILNWATAMNYFLERDGIMTSTGITQVSGLLYSSLADREREQPDLQFFFNGFYAECSGTGSYREPVDRCNPNKPMNISITGVALLPKSVGYLTLNSTNPLEPPLFYPKFFSHSDDMVMLKDAASYIKQIVYSDILQSKYGIKLDKEMTSQCAQEGEEWSENFIECIARLHTDPQNHQCGTAAIGYVIDPRLRVYHVERLRVIDASSIPIPPTGNPQGVIMMVAEKGSDMIKEDWDL